MTMISTCPECGHHTEISPWLKLLSPREKEVLGGLVDGLTPDEIAATQFVSVATVRTQIQDIYLKLGVNNALSAVAVANRAGWKARNADRIAEQRSMLRR